MTSFTQFSARCKMRHDFADQIQVRYHHPDGRQFDTWVSGDEILQRLETAARQRRIKTGIHGLTWEQIRQARQELPDQAKRKLRGWLQERLADEVEDALGENLFGDSLADRVRGRSRPDDPRAAEKARWQALLADEAFRAEALNLAWTNLDGSLPDEPDAEPDDWV